VLDVMIRQEHGRIVNVRSSGEAVCSAAKGGVMAFTKTMVRQLARHRINVNCICPGPPPAVVFLVSDEAASGRLTMV
jgi:2-hydroxycyclohexanecarboxyl-CoA dehydrogenase